MHNTRNIHDHNQETQLSLTTIKNLIKISKFISDDANTHHNKCGLAFLHARPLNTQILLIQNGVRMISLNNI